jgi:hypothetical protein
VASQPSQLGQLSQIVACYAICDEADTIAESVRSLKAYVDRFVVIDSSFLSNPKPATHSMDGTRLIVEALCASPPARPLIYIASDAKLLQYYARNAYLELVPTDDWVFVVDGDEVLYGDYYATHELFDQLRAPRPQPLPQPLGEPEPFYPYEVVSIPVYTTAINIDKHAPDITELEYTTRPLVSTMGYMPRLFRSKPNLRYTIGPGASTPVLTYLANLNESRPGVEIEPVNRYLLAPVEVQAPPTGLFLINHHTRQSLASYHIDYEWETKGVLP